MLPAAPQDTFPKAPCTAHSAPAQESVQPELHIQHGRNTCSSSRSFTSLFVLSIEQCPVPQETQSLSAFCYF